MTDPRFKRHLISIEAAREKQASKALDLLATSFPEQTAFIEDPAKFKAALCTRRAGKSYGTGIYLIQTALRNPRCSVLYLALTKDTARAIMVKDVLEPILSANGIEYGPKGYTFNKTTREYTFFNGSKLYLAGADAKPKEMEKVLGQKYALVVIDECASFSQDLDALINKLIPAVSDYDGTIALIGTPSNYTNNKFYELTRPDAVTGLWSVHRWSWRDNPHGLVNKTRAHDRLLEAEPNKVRTNSYKQEWLGEWAIDESALCYHFSRDNLSPQLPSGDYYYVLGVDLGWQDHTAFCVVAYSYDDPHCYIVETFNAQHLDFTAVASFTRELAKKYDFVRYVIDAGGGGKQGVEEMKARHDIPWQSTPKSPGYKFNTIRMMSDAFKTGEIRVLPHNEALIKEYSQLVWDENNPTQEKASCKNHLADASLYAFMASRHYRADSPKPTAPTPEAPEAEPPRYQTIHIEEEPLSWLNYGNL